MPHDLQREISVVLRDAVDRLALLSLCMENYHRRLVQIEVQKSCQIIRILAETAYVDKFEEKLRVLHTHLTALVGLASERLKVLSTMQENTSYFKKRLSDAISNINIHRELLIQATEIIVNNPDFTRAHQNAQKAEAENLEKFVKEVGGIVDEMHVKAVSTFDYNMKILENLDELSESVQRGDREHAQFTAKKLAQDVSELSKAAMAKGVADHNPDMRGALDDAIKRLRESARQLLLATHTASAQPNMTDNLHTIECLVDEPRQQVKIVRERVPLETLTASLPSSGMIEAATSAALQLSRLFSTDVPVSSGSTVPSQPDSVEQQLLAAENALLASYERVLQTERMVEAQLSFKQSRTISSTFASPATAAASPPPQPKPSLREETDEEMERRIEEERRKHEEAEKQRLKEAMENRAKREAEAQALMEKKRRELLAARLQEEEDARREQEERERQERERIRLEELRLAEERERRRREAQEAEWHEWEAKQAQLRAENARRHAETQAKLKELERQQSEKKVQLEGEKKKKKKPYELEEMLSRFEQEVEKQKQVLTVEVEKRMSSDGTKPLAQSLIEELERKSCNWPAGEQDPSLRVEETAQRVHLELEAEAKRKEERRRKKKWKPVSQENKEALKEKAKQDKQQQQQDKEKEKEAEKPQEKEKDNEKQQEEEKQQNNKEVKQDIEKQQKQEKEKDTKEEDAAKTESNKERRHKKKESNAGNNGDVKKHKKKKKKHRSRHGEGKLRTRNKAGENKAEDGKDQ